MPQFTDKVVIVTGGVNGIGSTISSRFAERGALVLVFDRDAPSTPESSHERISFFQGDVASRASVEEFVTQTISKHGRVDILVNNAGILRDNMIWRMSEEDFDAVIEVNLKGTWLMCKMVAPHMRERRFGRIVNITSRAWLGNPGQSNYSASKGGLVSLTRVLALELARSNVTVNAVAPGLIDTPMTRGLSEDVFKKLVAAQPSGHPGTPDDVAAAVCFLASDDASFITGQTIYVDGGKSIGASLI